MTLIMSIVPASEIGNEELLNIEMKLYNSI